MILVKNAMVVVSLLSIPLARCFRMSTERCSRIAQYAQEKNTISVSERIGRALSFYSVAVPIFVSYRGFYLMMKVRREVFHEVLPKATVDQMSDRLHDWGSDLITKKIVELRGYYVKAGQIISTRVDIFPKQYTSKLAVTQDALDPLPGYIIKNIVSRELLNGGELSELFESFDEAPLGSASIAQVHRAVLLDGRVVAVKVQRPGIDGKLLGDISNLKAFAKVVSPSLLIDYYKIFCEIEKVLLNELDFLSEAQSALKIASAIAHKPDNTLQKPPLIVPLPIPGLATRRVLVMEFVDGYALSQVASRFVKKKSDSAVNSTTGAASKRDVEALLFGTRLLSALTDAYAYMIFGSGIIHG